MAQGMFDPKWSIIKGIFCTQVERQNEEIIQVGVGAFLGAKSLPMMIQVAIRSGALQLEAGISVEDAEELIKAIKKSVALTRLANATKGS